jgi:hypothetical protein
VAVKMVDNSKSNVSFMNLGIEQLLFNLMGNSHNREEMTEAEMEMLRAKDFNVLDPHHQTIIINNRISGVQETTIEGMVTLIGVITDKTSLKEDHRDVIQTRAASLVRTHITIEMQAGKAQIQEEGPKTTANTIKASIVGIIKGTDVTTGDISEDINQ